MPRDTSFHDYVMDLLDDIPGITSRAMFSGWGIYKNKVFFALISNGELYFKVGEGNRADFEHQKSHPFVYNNKGKKTMMSYWLVPEEILEDPEVLFEWVEKAVLESKQSKKTKI